ncbi:MAG: hypothetical protein AAGF11_53635 [Myxococcota bacterium]
MSAPEALTDPAPSARSRSPWWHDGLPRLGLAAVLLAVAALCVPAHVQAGDAGEFATVMLEGGIPHPSGYPWMRILGLPARALVALGVSPARAAAWPCAAAGVAAWIVLWPLIAGWAGRGPATLAILVMATASPVLVHVPDSEVWGPHLLACAVVLRVAARDRVRPAVLGLGFGLATSHHLSATLLLPVVVGAAWPRPFGWRRLGAAASQGIAAGVAGLLPYTTLALGAEGAWRWGDPRSWSGLWRHVLRADYGTFQLSLHTEDPALLDQWSRAVYTVGNAATGGLSSGALTSAAALLGVAALAGRRPASLRPGVYWGLWGSVLASTLAVPAAHNIDPTRPFGAWILERFDLLSILLWTPLWALAAARVWRWGTRRPSRIAMGLLALTLVATQLARSAARGVPSSDDGVERYARDLLRTPTPGQRALVIGTDDHRVFPILFVQHVLGEGANVLYVDASLLSQRWYRRHLQERWPDLPEIDKPVALIGALWDDPAWADTPIFLANVFSRPSSQLPIVPQGLLWRVLPPHDRALTPQQVIDDHTAALARYGAPPTHTPGPAHPWTADLYPAYNEGTGRLLSALRAEGRAEALHTLLDALGPWRPVNR